MMAEWSMTPVFRQFLHSAVLTAVKNNPDFWPQSGQKRLDSGVYGSIGFLIRPYRGSESLFFR